MKATSIISCLALAVTMGATGACTGNIGDSPLGDAEASMEEGADNPDLGGDFGEDGEGGAEGTPTDPDDRGNGDDTPFDFPGDDTPYDFPGGDGGGDPGGDGGGGPGDGGGCVPQPEDCDNNVDDDCDGLFDEGDPDCDEECTWGDTNCSDVELIGHCNTHLGDNVNACYAAGNAGNCGATELYAWCSRRVDPGPGGAWYNYIRDWVDNRCNGAVQFQVINGEDYYTCTDQDACRTFECKTPLVMAFDVTQPVRYQADDGLTSFDLSTEADGSAVRTDWPTAATPWLALDRDGDGAITSGQELFGSATPMTNGTASHGFEPLAELDDNGDGILDALDAGFFQLRLWADANQDRLSQPEELRTLADYGIESIEVVHQVAPLCDDRGNCEKERSRFVWRTADGEQRVGAVIDVHLAVR